MRPAPFLLVALTAAALVGASPARCLAGMPDAAPQETPETPPCHEAPADVPQPAAPVGMTAACCVAPATAPDAPARLAPPVVSVAVVWSEPEPLRPMDVAAVAQKDEPPDRWAGPIRVVTGCFRI